MACRDISRRSRDAPRSPPGNRSAASPPCCGCRRRSDPRTSLPSPSDRRWSRTRAREAHCRSSPCPLKPDQHLLALLLVELVEHPAVGLAAIGIACRDAGAIELRGRERQLVTLARHAYLPRPLHIEPLALAPGARERAVNVDVDADLGAFGRELVGWHHVIDQRLDESRLVKVQELVALGRRLGGLLRLRARSRNGGCGGRCGRTARDRRFQEITPTEALIRHVFLPASDSTSWCQRSFLAWTKNAPFPVAAARLFSAGTASTHLESCNGLPTAGGCTGRCDTR